MPVPVTLIRDGEVFPFIYAEFGFLLRSLGFRSNAMAVSHYGGRDKNTILFRGELYTTRKARRSKWLLAVGKLLLEPVCLALFMGVR